jgi:SAM-dependent methyltransferase
MNGLHNLICSSRWWAGKVESELLPWALASVDVGHEVLEFGPGFGATTRVLARRRVNLNVLELDQRYCRRLQSEFGETVKVTQGDATAMPFADNTFSAVVCFTMLHHIPERDAQDRALAEAARVLRPGGVFAGSDSIGRGFVFKAIHVGDTLNLVDPDTFASRLHDAGFDRPQVDTGGKSFRFRAYKPGRPTA